MSGFCGLGRLVDEADCLGPAPGDFLNRMPTEILEAKGIRNLDGEIEGPADGDSLEEEWEQ